MSAASPLALQLLGAGIPPSLLIDLLDPEGMRVALAAELAASDVARAAATVPAAVAETSSLRTA